MQIQVGSHRDAITQRVKKGKLCTLPGYRFHKLRFFRSRYSCLFASIKINIVFLIICFILCGSVLACVVAYLQIQVGSHRDAITQRVKKGKLCTLPGYRFHKLRFFRSRYSCLFASIKINIVFLIICFILCGSVLA